MVSQHCHAARQPVRIPCDFTARPCRGLDCEDRSCGSQHADPGLSYEHYLATRGGYHERRTGEEVVADFTTNKGEPNKKKDVVERLGWSELPGINRRTEKDEEDDSEYME